MSLIVDGLHVFSNASAEVTAKEQRNIMTKTQKHIPNAAPILKRTHSSFRNEVMCTETDCSFVFRYSDAHKCINVMRRQILFSVVVAFFSGCESRRRTNGRREEQNDNGPYRLNTHFHCSSIIIAAMYEQ